MKFIVEAVVEVGRAVAVGNESTTGLGLQMCPSLIASHNLFELVCVPLLVFFFIIYNKYLLENCQKN